MSDGVRPINPTDGPIIDERRDGDRRRRDRRSATATGTDGKSLVVAGERVDHAPSSAKPAASAPPPLVPPAVFAAQVIGQSGQKRGLKGGPPVLEAARSTYLGTEYSGNRDRRPTVGRDTKTDI